MDTIADSRRDVVVLPGRPELARRGSGPIVAGAIAGAVAAAVLFLLAPPRPVPTPSLGSMPRIVIQADGAPYSALAWYADGTQGDASAAMTAPWTPAQPVLMLTVAAANSCAIVIEDHLATAVTAPVNRLAVCVWRSS